MKSILEVYNMATGERRALMQTDAHIEAPNWTADGEALIYNSAGQLFRYALNTGAVAHIPTGRCNRCNNDHVLSPDGKWIAISSGCGDEPSSRVWVVPIGGGEPRLVTPGAPSYLHGISPDGKTLAYCARRGGEYDIYVIPAQGGEETRLTDAPGLNDGPEYSPDGEYIYFNSVRTGSMQIWRMRPDGSGQQQLTGCEEWHNWFPHVSPGGEDVVFLSYRQGDVRPDDHPANKSVALRRMPYGGGEITTLFEAFGGQGTVNVNSWAPDGKRFAFVTYAL